MTGSAHTIGSFEVSDTDYYNVHFYADDHCSSTFITSWSDSFPSAGEPVIWNSNAYKDTNCKLSNSNDVSPAIKAIQECYGTKMHLIEA